MQTGFEAGAARAGARDAPLLLVCREGCEAVLREEAEAKGATALRAGPGWLALAGGDAPAPFVFEQQRLEQAAWLDDRPVRELARRIVVQLLPAIARSPLPWTLHAFASNPNAAQPLTQRVALVGKAVLAFCSDRFTAVSRRYRPPDGPAGSGAAWVLQLCAAPGGLWGAAMPAMRLSAAWPGGVCRMRFDSRAPSRSYLKIEEAFERLGEAPKAGQRVVDLGAAPGGWTYAFLKRGCRVLAVDRGPLKLKSIGEAGGRLTHLTENGLSFVPPPAWRPADWMVSDMLVAPGQALSVFRTWAERGWAKRFVFAVKLPQEHPWPVLAPVEAALRRYAGGRFQLRQLYHDRREVTAFGRLPPPVGAGAHPPQFSRGRARRA